MFDDLNFSNILFVPESHKIPQSTPPKTAPIRPERPRSSHLVHSASFRATKPNKASMTLMLAAASICAADALERHLAPPGFECCERELLGRSWLGSDGRAGGLPRPSDCHKNLKVGKHGAIVASSHNNMKSAHASISTPWASQKLSFTAFESWWRQLSF